MTKSTLSVVYVVKNGGSLFSLSLASIQNRADEIVVVDNKSTDMSVHIAQKTGARIYKNISKNEGTLRRYALSKVHCDWILFLDHDEIVSTVLAKEIVKIILSKSSKQAYMIPYRNHLFGRELKHAGEMYSMLRLFKKGSVYITNRRVHASFETNKPLGATKHTLDHYSYSSLLQIITKFTIYAKKHAQEKYERRELVTPQKIVLYAPHLFWTRFIVEKGYKDGGLRFLLDMSFAYMEFATYVYLWYLYIHNKNARK